MLRSKRCDRLFFDRPHLEVARDLLCCELVWDEVTGIIVETESYGNADDPACHTATRPSTREFIRRNPPGTVYAYINYGMYWLLNVLAADGIILIRALEPIHGIPLMRNRRNRRNINDLCSGPGKIGQSLALGPQDHGTSLLSRRRHIRRSADSDSARPILTDVRVGISQGLDREWRFLVAQSPCISVPYGKALQKSRAKCP